MYPMKHAGHAGAGLRRHGQQGLAGLELQYNKQLAGSAGSEVVVRDPAGHALKTRAAEQPVDAGATCA